MEILLEHLLNQNVKPLDRSWASNSSFILVPNGSGRWAEQQHWTRQLPIELEEGKFGLLTSGSTGEPRLLFGEKCRSENLVTVLHQLQESEPISQCICVLPVNYSYAFINQWLWSHKFQRRFVHTKGFREPDSLRSALCHARDAMLCLVGSQVPLIRRYFPDAAFPGIIRLHFAGGRFPQEQLPFLHERFPNAQIFNNYGCAEAMPRLTIRRAEDADDASNIGWTLPGVEMKSGADKKLFFRSPYGAVAYVDDGGFHRIADEDWVPTGDLGEQLPDGSWRLLGRANDVFKRFGEKISIAQLLTMVKTHWDGDAAFYQEVDPAGEQACILVLSPEPSEAQLREVLLAFRKGFTRTHWPLRIESLNEFPLLPNGKPDLMGMKNADNKKLHWRQRV